MERSLRRSPMFISGVIFVLASIALLIAVLAAGGALSAYLICVFVLLMITILVNVLITLKAVRSFLTMFGVFIIGIPFSFFFSYREGGTGGSALLFLGIWSLLCGFLTRSAKGIYWSLHLAIWLVGLSLIAFFPSGGDVPFPPLFWLLLPLGLSIVLFAQYATVMSWLGTPGFVKKATPDPQAANRPREATNHLPYEQGYRTTPTYQEGGQSFSYPQPEQPQAQYPRGMTQQ